MLLDWLAYKGGRDQPVLLFTHSSREKTGMHTVPKGKGNTNILVQDLNSGSRVHFKRRKPFGFGLKCPTHVKSTGFRSQLEASREYSHTDEL